MPVPLYQKHPPSLAAVYADVENHALHQDEILVGTPGSITPRQNANGTKFYVRQYYDFDRRKRDQYLCQLGAPDCEPLVEAWKERIVEAKQLQASTRLLAREGFSLLQPKHLAALAPLARHGVFGAGAILVGTHAFEVIANRLGIRVATFSTEDVTWLAWEAVAGKGPGGLLSCRNRASISSMFFRAPLPSYVEKALIHVRPSFPPREKDRTIPVPELDAHATALLTCKRWRKPRWAPRYNARRRGGNPARSVSLHAGRRSCARPHREEPQGPRRAAHRRWGSSFRCDQRSARPPPEPRTASARAGALRPGDSASAAWTGRRRQGCVMGS